ncbi:hypothetical protein [Bacillus sp. B1-b2]|uniref:hypothetical protein n=1 Tax=Bacillus sp. B1-b2 TaxID=2653201 RepID=UPI0012627D47|nr:hypothetical protein [Bacillus sp. B1-b2]KAB7671993.1 hypothetical protein F9279_03465 [Bacillus sp. B1-b2]
MDYVYESGWEIGLSMGTVIVEPNAAITIDFNKKPCQGSLKVAEVYEDGEEEMVIVESNRIYAPQ